MEVTKIDINSIRPYPKNAKKHEKRQIDLVANSIKRFGWAQPIAIDQNGEIIIGHCRLLAAKQLGLTEVPIVRLENLTPEEVSALRLADNKLNESDWDMSLALEDLKPLPAELFDLTGFDKDLLIDPNEKDDVIPEVKEIKSKSGDLYELGRNRVLCGDATKREDVEKVLGGGA